MSDDKTLQTYITEQARATFGRDLRIIDNGTKFAKRFRYTVELPGSAFVDDKSGFEESAHAHASSTLKALTAFLNKAAQATLVVPKDPKVDYFKFESLPAEKRTDYVCDPSGASGLFSRVETKTRKPAPDYSQN